MRLVGRFGWMCSKSQVSMDLESSLDLLRSINLTWSLSYSSEKCVLSHALVPGL